MASADQIATVIAQATMATVVVSLAAAVGLWSIFSVKLIRDEQVPADDDDIGDYMDAGELYASCSECGMNSIDDGQYFDLDHSDACPQCGADLDIERVG